MTFNDYQQTALSTAIDDEFPLIHRVLGLVGETGEIAEKLKKLYRDHGGDMSKLDKDDMKKELGDVMWYVATLADHLGLTLEDIVESNAAKLKSRQQRGVLGGSGDNR